MSSTADASQLNGDAAPPCDDSGLSEAEFRFRNIGPIHQAALTLGGLTVIAGRNNTGKTYLVYTLYGFLKASREIGSYFLDLVTEEFGGPTPANSIARDLRSSGQASFPMDADWFNRYREASLKFVTNSFTDGGLADVFTSNWDAFENASFEASLPHREPPPSIKREAILAGGGFLYMQYDGKEVEMSLEKATSRRSIREIHHHVTQFFVDLLLQDLPNQPFILSAERFGISLFYRELDFTKNQIVDLLQRMGDGKDSNRDFPYLLIDSSTSRYAQPIKDNIDYTRSIPDLKEQRSRFYEDKLFDDIRDMMGGHYGSSGSDIRFISKARGRRKFNIPLHLASSSARGLSDLYFFLRHVARNDQLLIVDEPESHLDTANQRLMARLLARFVRAGIKVLITTHSDYIIKEFNNLIMLSTRLEGRERVAKKLGYSTEDYLQAESVRAYVAEKNSLTRCAVDQFGMEMPVFDDSIDNINSVANELSARVEGIG